MDNRKGSEIYHINNALKAGESAHAILMDMKSNLISARRWGYLDILKGKALLTYIKRRYIRRAEKQARQASRALMEFNRILTNLDRNPDLRINFGRHGVFFDYFLDNAVFDLIVQTQINGNIRKIDATLVRIEKILKELRGRKVQLNER